MLTPKQFCNYLKSAFLRIFTLLLYIQIIHQMNHLMWFYLKKLIFKLLTLQACILNNKTKHVQQKNIKS
ncbi:hypothetical protein AHS86_11515 [Salmonella enterica subsp. enterica]|nr:hypothetical protein [Salmonella enterica subsp. enterica serovar Ruiru]EAA8632163.1 hypothetical protein [Salmonella enterica subsp. enterica]EAQ6851060.1 hypothetical protein [Salmonella enterica]EBW7344864.1 hypothetical protein [Salmonella enterica subsp. enterica serovar Ruiru]